MKYLRQNESGFHYRRRVPGNVVDRIGKREFKLSLGKTQGAALRAYAAFEREVEWTIAEARAAGRGSVRLDIPNQASLFER